MPAWVVPAILGASALAGALTGRSDRRRATEQFDAQMDQTIQRRVVDAKKAGIHPLFALGANAGASPTVYAGGGGSSQIADVGRTAVAAYGAYSTAKKAPAALAAQAALAAAQIGSLNASATRDESAALLNNANVARITQNAMSTGLDGLDSPTQTTEGIIERNAARVTESFPGQPGVEAGVRPGTIAVRTPDGGKITILSPELGLDEIAQVDYVWQRAKQRGGDAVDAVRRYIQKLYKSSRKYLRSTDPGYRRY